MSGLRPLLHDMGLDFQDTTLVLIGHGSTVSDKSAAPVFHHANRIRKRRLFADVRACFWRQKPDLASSLSSLANKQVIFIPFFIADGYFTEEAIPMALGFRRDKTHSLVRTLKKGAQCWYYSSALGHHPMMYRALLAKALGILKSIPTAERPTPDQCALIVVGHGTLRNKNSRTAVESQVARMAASGVFGETHAVFLEEDPSLEACYGMARARHLIVTPFFIGDGPHTSEDIPGRLGVANPSAGWAHPIRNRGKLLWICDAVGFDPMVEDIILQKALLCRRTDPSAGNLSSTVPLSNPSHAALV